MNKLKQSSRSIIFGYVNIFLGSAVLGFSVALDSGLNQTNSSVSAALTVFTGLLLLASGFWRLGKNDVVLKQPTLMVCGYILGVIIGLLMRYKK